MRNLIPDVANENVIVYLQKQIKKYLCIECDLFIKGEHLISAIQNLIQEVFNENDIVYLQKQIIDKYLCIKC